MCIIDSKLENSVRDILDEFLDDNYFIHYVTEIDSKINQSKEWKYNIKLDIVNFDRLRHYNKIVYSDSDVIFSKHSILPLFDVIKNPNTIYVKPEEYHFTAPFFYKKEIYTKQNTKQIFRSVKNRPINTGHFGWLNSDNITFQFNKVIDDIDKYYSVYDSKEHVYDQVFLNKRWLLDQNIEYMYDKLITLNPELSDKQGILEKIVYHFTYINKVNRMRNILQYIKNKFNYYIC